MFVVVSDLKVVNNMLSELQEANTCSTLPVPASSTRFVSLCCFVYML